MVSQLRLKPGDGNIGRLRTDSRTVFAQKMMDFSVRVLVALITLSLLLTSICFGVEYPFTSDDILGRDIQAGSTVYDPKLDFYTVTGDGHDIWDTEDDFRFLHVEMSGDFSVSVRVDDPRGRWPHSWSKAGIMVRQDLSPGSKDVYLVATRDNGVAFQWRDNPNSSASWTGASEPPNPLSYPVWLRIVHTGDEFTGWYSEDGKSWVRPAQNTHFLLMSDPVLVGICLTSHLSGVLATATFGDFHIPELEASTVAVPPAEQTCHEGDTVLLDGTKSWNAIAFRWEQVILADEPRVAIANANQATARFVAPQLDIGAVLTFRLTVYSSSSKDSAVTRVAVRAKNSPILPPGNLRAEPGNLSATLHWQSLLDADSYVVKRAEQLPNGERSAFQTIRPSVEDTAVVDEYLDGGTTYFYVVSARNSFPPYEGPPSNEISLTAMPNLALRSDATPIALVTAPTGGGLKNLNAIMNGNTQENYDTFDNYKTLDEDWFGYSWPEALYFDRIVYYEGQHFDDGGWWTGLTVQVSDDGTSWREAPNVEINPPYDFTDSRSGRKPYSRFDITFKPVLARSIRIYGTPGGIAGFTSIAELEVYGNQNRDALTVYGLDRAFDERSTAFLDARHSFSTRGPIVQYHWQQTGGSPPVVLQNADSPLASFTAPGVDQDTPLFFTLTASDAFDEKTDEVEIVIRNIVTKANAGSDLAAPEGTSVQLDGTASRTTSGTIGCQWTQMSGPTVALTDGGSLRPSFTAPYVSNFSERLTFQLQVDDGLGRADSISSDTVTVLVKNTLSTMAHLEKSGLIVIEAENYTSINRRTDDRGMWCVVEGQPTYVEVPDNPGAANTRTWQDAAEISYDVKVRHTGNYFVKLRRSVPHGGGHEGGSNNSCFMGINGKQVGAEFDNSGTYNTWVWAPSRQSEPLSFSAPGTYTLNIRCREDGYRIDRVILYQPGAAGVPEDWSSEIGPAESAAEGRIVCSRELGTHYIPGTTHLVSLHLDVNTPTITDTIVLVEYFPRNLSLLDSGGGDGSVPGTLFWTLSSDKIANGTFSYLLVIPGTTTGPLAFSGNLFYGDVTNQPTFGQTSLYPVPSPPQSVSVEMLVGATVSWLPNSQGVLAYHVYRSSDGKNWTDVSGPRRQSPFVDTTVQPGATYVYKVCAESPTGVQTPLASCTATFPQSAQHMEIREAEDYDYAGGRFPGGPNAPAATGASSADEVDSGLDYFYQNETRINTYRPQDQVDIRPGEGASGWFMGYSTTGDWWRYTFDVPVAGYVKLAYRGSTSGAVAATIEFLWDEKPVGTIIYNTPGGWRDWTYYSLQPFFSGPGRHVLRMRLAAGNADYDQIALGYDWNLDGRKVIFAEDFEGYSETSQVSSSGGWTILSGSSSLGAWQLWDTASGPLTTQPHEPGPDLPGMTGNYIVSNGDFAPGVPLDEQLISPEIDCTGYEGVGVEFLSHINIDEDDTDGDLQTTDFDLSFYDDDSRAWSDWFTVFTHDRSSGDQSSTTPLSFDVSTLADGKKVKLRWHFYNTRNDFWWAIDNVVVSGRRLERARIGSTRISGGNVLTLTWERFGTGYYAVQYTDDLNNPVWVDAEGTDWPIIATAWSGTLPAGNRQRFYRVTSR